MRPITKHQKQWLWFVGLWLAGFVSVAVLAYAVRWLIRL
jgi:hypothetical protein